MSEPDRKQTKWWLYAAWFAATVTTFGALVAQSGWGILVMTAGLVISLIAPRRLGFWIADRIWPNPTETNADD